jgi:uncharacterized protein YbjT (DUF2867 family)
VLTQPGHERAIYNVVGAEPVSLAGLAEIASEVTGKAYRYEPEDRDAWMDERLARGRPRPDLEVILSSFDAIRLGELDVVADDYRAITGRAPLTAAEVIARHLDAMPLA